VFPGRRGGNNSATGDHATPSAPSPTPPDLSTIAREILVGGAIALAAWTQVFVSSESPPADRLSGATLALLFGGAMILLSSPLLFRREGLHLTFIGRESATFLGYGAIVLSMCGAILDLVSGYWMAVAVVLAAVIAVRDLIDVRTHLKLMKDLNF
jgi:hypothetical protein